MCRRCYQATAESIGFLLYRYLAEKRYLRLHQFHMVVICQIHYFVWKFEREHSMKVFYDFIKYYV